ncbi:MAG: helix-turn-helix domain-containing protein [Alphaproteobacteria bacterium]|nr:LexA family transcriptional regulator [Alphaproteobacteria bacterium]TAD91039.1 MAG: helix-turn-helix domain-containing protein [Alphaproteobacteria bacterium]
MTPLRVLRVERGLTLDQLADSVGTTAQQIGRLERGERRLTVDWMVRLAPALGVEPKDLIGAAALTAAQAEGAVRTTTRAVPGMLPVRSAARGGGEQEMFLLDGAIDHVPMPEHLRNVRDAYAIWVVGDSMVPRFRAGTLLHVNPYKPARRDHGVVVFKTNDAVLIKDFLEATPEVLLLRQYNPPLDLTLPRREVRSWHTVVGTEEP